MTRLKAHRMGHKSNSFLITLLLWLFVGGILIFLLWSQNNLLLTQKYVYGDVNLPKSFVGYKVVHISDICNSKINVAKAVEKAKPDIIILSGGYSDSNGNSGNTLSTVNKLTDIAPVFYIYSTNDKGNELDSTKAVNVTDSVIRLNPISMDANTFIKNNYGDKIIKKAQNKDEDAMEYVQYIQEQLSETSNSELIIYGISNYTYDNGVYDASKAVMDVTDSNTDTTIIGLLGNLNYVSEIAKTDIDTLFLGGTFGVDGALPGYKKGTYGLNGTQLFISGGVGKNPKIKRIFNFPEIQYITLSDGTITDDNPLENFISIFYNDVGTIFDNDGGFKEYKYEYDGSYSK